MDNVNSVTPTADCVGLIGPMKAAWGRTFKDAVDALAPLLVIVWHSEWMRPTPERNLWRELHAKLKNIRTPARILVVIFGDTPDDLGEEKQGRPLGVFLSAIAADSRRPAQGDPHRGGAWVSISDVSHFSSAIMLWAPVRKRDSALLRLCELCAALDPHRENSRSRRGPVPTLEEFFQFLASPMSFRARKLHAAKSNDAESAKLGLRVLKWLASCVFVPRSLPINILLVENAPDALRDRNANIRRSLVRALHALKSNADPLGYLRNATIYLVKDEVGFQGLKSRDRWADLEAEVVSFNGDKLDGGPRRIPWSDLDLILQDIVLDELNSELGGLDLAPHYFEACPQALVFLLTSLDVESLVGSGDVNWRYVDCIVSKDALQTLWYEYHRCFQERFGRMFWSDWGKAGERERSLLRNLYGSLRKWQIEPDILWHGQTLPEMIDHANRHITALWRLVNGFIATLVERGGGDDPILDLQHRVALALAVWMHDVGHRGDQYVAGSMDIRASHAGISERLLLRNPEAYGLGWMLDEEWMPIDGCRRQGSRRLECRNEAGCENGGSLCLLREVGLLCRHHQSNAPLDEKSVEYMAQKSKTPSNYSLVPFAKQPEITGETFLAGMTNDASPLPSPSGTALRRLDQFELRKPAGFRNVAGILRMLDALQLHRSRVGSAASINSFEEFLDNRFGWCSTKRAQLEEALRTALPGTRAFQCALKELDDLGEYAILLNCQTVHFWRQAVAHEVEVVWRWQAEGKAYIDVDFTLNEGALKSLRDRIAKVPTADGDAPASIRLAEALYDEDVAKLRTSSSISLHPLSSEIKCWLHNVCSDVIESEHNSQYWAKQERTSGYLGVLAPHVVFRVVVSNTDQKAFNSNERDGREPAHVIYSAS